MLSKLLIVMAALWLCGCSAAVKHKPKQKTTDVPGHCIVVDKLYDCDVNDVCKAHIKIKPIPGCYEFDHRNFLRVPK